MNAEAMRAKVLADAAHLLQEKKKAEERERARIQTLWTSFAKTWNASVDALRGLEGLWIKAPIRKKLVEGAIDVCAEELNPEQVPSDSLRTFVVRMYLYDDEEGDDHEILHVTRDWNIHNGENVSSTWRVGGHSCLYHTEQMLLKVGSLVSAMVVVGDNHHDPTNPTKSAEPAVVGNRAIDL